MEPVPQSRPWKTFAVHNAIYIFYASFANKPSSPHSHPCRCLRHPSLSPKPDEVGISAERLKRIHDVIQTHLDARDFDGSVTLVARKGKVVHLERPMVLWISNPTDPFAQILYSGWHP